MINGFYLNNNEIHFKQTLSLTLPFQRLRGSEIWYAAGDWGRIIVQDLQRLKYSISLTFFEFTGNSLLEVQPQGPGLATTAAIKNKVYQIICGAGKIFLNEHQFVSAYGTALHKYVQFKKAEQTITLDIHWSEEMLHDLFPPEHPYRSLLIQMSGTYPTLIGEPYRIIDVDLKEIHNGVLNGSYSDDIRQEWEQSIVEDYLYQVLASSEKELDLNGAIDEIEMQKIKKATEYIITNLQKRFTIIQVAEHVGLSATTLKMRFRQLTGKGVFEYLMHQRFLRIRDELLHTNKPLKALFKDSGYRDVPAFINGFKRQMGCSPAAFRNGKL